MKRETLVEVEVSAIETCWLALRQMSFEEQVRVLVYLVRRFTDEERERIDRLEAEAVDVIQREHDSKPNSRTRGTTK